MAAHEQVAALRRDLEGLIGRLDDLILELLSEAIERGEQRRPEIERRLTRVRNAVVRAASILEEEG